MAVTGKWGSEGGGADDLPAADYTGPPAAAAPAESHLMPYGALAGFDSSEPCTRWADDKWCGVSPTRRHLTGHLCINHAPVAPAPDPAGTLAAFQARRSAELHAIRVFIDAAGPPMPPPSKPARRPTRPDCPYCTPAAGYGCLAPGRCDTRLGRRC